MNMDPQLQRRVQRYGWDRAAPFYESAWQKQLKPAQDRLLEMAAITEGEKVIDIACGSGLISFRMAKACGPNGLVFGNDISDKMIERCLETAESLDIRNTRFERMEAENLQVEDECFDVAVCSLGLMYVPDFLQAIREMRRVVHQNGRVLSLVWGRRDKCGWADIFEIVDKRVSSEVCPMFFQLGNPSVLQKYYESAGLSNITIQKVSTTLVYNSGEEACVAAFSGGPVAMAYSRFPEATRREVEAEYLESIRPFYDGRHYEIPGEFLIALGNR